MHKLIGAEKWPILFVTLSQLLTSVFNGPPHDSKLCNDNEMIRQSGHASLGILHRENVVAARGYYETNKYSIDWDDFDRRI